jgi:hypothetical protein
MDKLQANIEIDPLLCPHCGAEMKAISFLDNLRGILSPELAMLINLLDNCIIFGYFANYENE